MFQILHILLFGLCTIFNHSFLFAVYSLSYGANFLIFTDTIKIRNLCLFQLCDFMILTKAMLLAFLFATGSWFPRVLVVCLLAKALLVATASVFLESVEFCIMVIPAPFPRK